MKPHGRPTDVYSLACFFLELTVGVPTEDTLQAKVCTVINLGFNPLSIPVFFFSDFKCSAVMQIIQITSPSRLHSSHLKNVNKLVDHIETSHCFLMIQML